MSNRYKLLFEVHASTAGANGDAKYGEYYFDTATDEEAVERVALLVHPESTLAAERLPPIGEPDDKIEALSLYRIVRLPRSLCKQGPKLR